MTAGPVRELFRSSGGNGAKTTNDIPEDYQDEEDKKDEDERVITPIDMNEMLVLNDREIADGGSGSRRRQEDVKDDDDEPLRIVDGSVYVVTGYTASGDTTNYIKLVN